VGLFILPCSAAPAVTPGRAGPGLSLADPLDDVELLKAGARDVRFTAKAAIAYSSNSSARARSCGARVRPSAYLRLMTNSSLVFREHSMGEAVGAVVLVPATTAVLSAWACARGRRGAAGVALGFSQGFPR
jgi:hypothetical protein